MVAAKTGLTTAHQSDGSTIYSGAVAAGQIATETGFKEGQAIRVLPFGYVAHGAAADPSSLLHTAVTVGSDGVIREIAVMWGTWTYTVAYSDLGPPRRSSHRQTRSRSATCCLTAPLRRRSSGSISRPVSGRPGERRAEAETVPRS
jgi:hypothetical protein